MEQSESMTATLEEPGSTNATAEFDNYLNISDENPESEGDVFEPITAKIQKTAADPAQKYRDWLNQLDYAEDEIPHNRA